MNIWTRRDFMKGAAACGLAGLAPRGLLGGLEPAGKPLRLAVVGVGDVTHVHYPWVVQGGHTVTVLCDVDQRRLDPVKPMISMPDASFPKGFPEARRLTDYREVFAKHADEFDAVLCASADHHHFGITELALTHDKHVYCEKPLGWSPEEAARLGELSREHEVATQLGNQGNSSNGWRFGDGYYQQGDLGDIVEVHGWVHLDGPVATHEPPRFPLVSDPVPEYLDWKNWLGPAGEYPYLESAMHPAAWRWWLPFGGGQIGDWGCHIFGGLFMTLEHLGYPSRVEVVKKTTFNGDYYPQGMTVKWHFPARAGKSAMDMYLHTSMADDPEFYPPRPAELEPERTWPPSNDGCYWVGTKSTFLMHQGHNSVGAIIPNEKRRELGRPELRFPLMKGNNFNVHGTEWLAAASGEKEWSDTISNFGYGAKLTMIVHMGNAALRAGRAIDVNPETGWPVKEADRVYFCRQNADTDWYSL